MATATATHNSSGSNASADPSIGFLDRHYFVLRKLHSLSGLLPLGAFLMYHFFGNAKIMTMGGAEAWNHHKEEIHSLPGFLIIEWVTVLLPLAFHAFYGLYIWSTGRSNIANFPYGRNYYYLAQRFSGVFLVVFLAYHIFSTRISEMLGWVDVTAAWFHDYMTIPRLIFYTLGVLAASFHLANGLWSMSVHWGLVIGKDAQERVAQATMGLFVLLSIAGISTAVAFHMGNF